MEIELLNRGNIVICVLQGDFGKGRPAVVVQSELFNSTHASIVVCPITTHLVDATLFRLPINPTKKSGLKKKSQIMVDKISAIKREKITQHVGELTIQELQSLDNALKLWLNL